MVDLNALNLCRSLGLSWQTSVEVMTDICIDANRSMSRKCVHPNDERMSDQNYAGKENRYTRQDRNSICATYSVSLDDFCHVLTEAKIISVSIAVVFIIVE